MKTSTFVIDHLAAMGIQRPAPALVTALEAVLAPRVSALVARTLSKRVVAQAFASTLFDADAQGSPEGGIAPALASSPELVAEAKKPEGVPGAPVNPEAM